MISEYHLDGIDRHFSRFLTGAAPAADAVSAAVAVCSNVVGNGSICLPLADIAGRTVLLDGKEVGFPPLAELSEMLRQAEFTGSPGDCRPLVLDGQDRLYLYRYWKYERELAKILREKCLLRWDADDRMLLPDLLQRLFPVLPQGEADMQRVAAESALLRKFCVVSGGPGTGKTSTVVKIIALMLQRAGRNDFPIALAAPTGKAAARLRESIVRLKERLDCDAETLARIPAEVTTIHRLLGPIEGSIHFRHRQENPLPHCLVIVDEASMIPLPLMYRLASAVKPQAGLILLGDRDQLASVEAGAVLGDICGNRDSGGAGSPLAGSVVTLHRNYRFGDDSGIGAVARAVNGGEGETALSILKDPSFPDISWHAVPEADGLERVLAPSVVAGFSAAMQAATAREALAALDSFRILCGLRQGPFGVTGVNLTVERILASRGLIRPDQRWYRGRPLLITANDYGMKLFNGDMGIVFPDDEENGSPKAWFPAADGSLRKFSTVRLPPHDTAYAMTIHKSQGSEFDQVLLLLPGQDSELLTRELIYTGITRARSKVELWGEETVFKGAVSKRIIRTSGLRELLWGPMTFVE